MMERKNIGSILFIILFTWSLWRSDTALSLLIGFFNLLMPFIIGACLAFIINVLLVPVENLWQKLFARFSSDWPQKLRRPVCLLVILVAIIGIVLVAILKIAPDLYQSFNMIIKMLPKASDELAALIQHKWDALALSPDTLNTIQKQWSDFLHYVDSFWENNKTSLFYSTVNATTSIIALISNTVIGIVFAIYLLLDKETLAKRANTIIVAFCKPEQAAYLLDISQSAYRIFAGYINGQLLEAFCLGILCLIGMLVLDLPYALSISALVGFLAIIPILGTIISAVLGIILIGIAAPDKLWWFILLFLVLQRIEGDILYPKIVGKSVDLPEIWVLAAITVGGSLGGILGIIISVPIASLAAYMFNGLVEKQLRKKNPPSHNFK